MKKKTLLSIILALISAALAIVAYIILPDTVIIQFSVGSSDNTTAPKLLAILIPTALGIGGAVITLLSKDEVKPSAKSLVLSVVGIGICIVMMIVNSNI